MTKKAATKKVVSKVVTKANSKLKSSIRPKAKTKTKTQTKAKKIAVKKNSPDDNLFAAILELIRKTSAEIPSDVQKVILEALEREEKNTSAEYAMGIIKANIELARKKSQPLCQDTGTVIVYVEHPKSMDTHHFEKLFKKAVVLATKKGYLRQNSVDSLTGENAGLNLGPGHPSFHFHQGKSNKLSVKLMLKGGGCENVGAQYSLPHTELGAGRDLEGVRKVILDAVFKAQGKGCGPGVLGICIGGDRGDGYAMAKEQLLRKLPDSSPVPELAQLEKVIVETSNKLGIGPMGFGGKTTLLGCKITALNRLPASFFVSISYMCWAFRRQGIELKADGSIAKWLY
jgi:fumarate hydratase class I